jgi:hypothetical protein
MKRISISNFKEMKTPSDTLIEIIEIIKGKITPDTDIVWTRYNSVEELNIDLDKIINGILKNENGTFSKLEILFAPTGSFQELSLTNGWGEEFLKLSEMFDYQIEKLKH